MAVVMLDQGSLAPSDLDFSELFACEQDWRIYHQTVAAEVRERIADAEIVFTNKVLLDGEAIAGASRLKLIAVMATGVNNIDLDAARERGVAVCNCVGYATPSVVQHTFALMLGLATRLHGYAGAVQQGQWSRSPFFCFLDYPIMELAGKTLGIVGYGELGRAVGRVAEVLGMTVMVAESLRSEASVGGASESRPPLATVLAAADVISLHCPLTEQTRGLINAHTLAAMKPGALLINTARGPLIDEAALRDALLSGRLGGAGLDVLHQEPPPADHPLLRGDLPNLLITPHCAWASRESRQRLLAQLRSVLESFRAGALVNRVV